LPPIKGKGVRNQIFYWAQRNNPELGRCGYDGNALLYTIVSFKTCPMIIKVPEISVFEKAPEKARVYTLKIQLSQINWTGAIDMGDMAVIVQVNLSFFLKLLYRHSKFAYGMRIARLAFRSGNPSFIQMMIA